MYELVDTIYCY